VYVFTPTIDNVAGFQTFDLDISSIRAALGNTINDIYFQPGSGFPANATLKVDDIKFVASGTPLSRVAATPVPVVNLEQKINFFPNPVNQEVTIALTQSYSTSIPIRIINSAGKTVMELTLEKGVRSKKINTIGFPSGMYFIQMKTSKGIFKKEMIIAH